MNTDKWFRDLVACKKYLSFEDFQQRLRSFQEVKFDLLLNVYIRYLDTCSLKEIAIVLKMVIRREIHLFIEVWFIFVLHTAEKAIASSSNFQYLRH